MAQAVAACLGYEAFRGGEGVRVGMLIGVRKMQLSPAPIPVGSELAITVERTRGNDDVSTFEGVTRLHGRDLATAQMTLFHAEKPP
jgi:predicted hotdog family 3-hydroxylacyl-ACP dehydratase